MDLTTVARADLLINPASSSTTEGSVPDHKVNTLRNLIIGVSAAAEKFLDRYAHKAVRTEYFDVRPYQRRFRLMGYPVTAVSRVNFDPDQGWAATEDIEAADYLSPVYDECGVLEVKYDLVTAGRGCSRALLVSYTGGMATDTEAFVKDYPDIAAAVDQQVAFLFHRRNDLGASSLTTERGTVSVPDVKPWLPAVRAVLVRHRRIPFAA